jgi:hypothetical protein
LMRFGSLPLGSDCRSEDFCRLNCTFAQEENHEENE